MRFSTLLFIILIIFTLFVSSLPATADTRYVSDELIITLRQGKSTQHKIIKTLKTGTPLEVLEEGKTYLKVRTTDGTEGYVLRQYITTAPPKAQRIKELETLNSSLQKKISHLEDESSDIKNKFATGEDTHKQVLSALNAKYEAAEQELQQTVSREQVLTEKYNTLQAQSENVIEIAAERDQLQQQNNRLENDNSALLQRNKKLSNSRMIKWFLAGGGVFFFGWLIGKISRKKRRRL